MESFNKSVRIHCFEKLEYGSPFGFLGELRKFEREHHLDLQQTEPKIRNLRTRGLKPARETRSAALFCVGMSKFVGPSIRFCPQEAEDYDCVVTYVDEDARNYVPVQLKEVVPDHLNPNLNIQKVVDGLAKYTSSEDLAVAIHLNRAGRFEPESLKVPEGVNVGSLWVFGAVSEDQHEWVIWGDFMQPPAIGVSFTYPE